MGKRSADQELAPLRYAVSQWSARAASAVVHYRTKERAKRRNMGISDIN